MLEIRKLPDSELREMREGHKFLKDYSLRTMREMFGTTAYAFVPEYFAAKHVDEFLGVIEEVFKRKKIELPFYFSFKKTKRISLLGMIIAYKFMSYTYKNAVFNVPMLDLPRVLLNEFYKCGLIPFMLANMQRNSTLHSFVHLQPHETELFFLYPEKLFRSEIDNAENVKGQYISKIGVYYDRYGNRQASLPISHCVGELIMNFWAHATEESETIVAAKGSRDKFTLVLADNGEGIITNLSRLIKGKDKIRTLRLCIEKNVSSKKNKSFHMGYGLFYVSELAKINNGSLHIWSEGAHLAVTNKNTRCTSCGYWKGTIVELTLGLSSPKSIADLPCYKSYNPDIRINFGGQ